MRVLVLTSWYPNQNNFLSGVFVREQAQALKETGVEAAVFYPFDEDIKEGELQLNFEDGLTTYRSNTATLRNRYLARFASYYLAVRQLKEITKEFKPDLIHVHVGYPASVIAYFYTRTSNIPYVITEHMSYLKDYVDKWIHRIFLKPAFENSAMVFPVSPFLGDQLRSFGWKLKIEPVPNVVDVNRFSKNQINNRNIVNILFVGHMDKSEVKGVPYLLKAYAEVLRDLDKTIHLHLVGDGPFRNKYEKLAEELGIGSSCTFHGRLSPDEMPQMFKSCDFLVVSSVKETFGVVLIEAMASGKPVLATACGGPNWIVTKEVGFLVEPGSVSALANGLKLMLESFDKYSPDIIRDYAIRNYSPEAISKKLQSLYVKIL
ncbi:MAG: glycosyltransferase family 4 protein [Desulfitobacterium hafniense]|nr:glycosyltransferase family 4 protein [Desulfitobacterium hafniense]